MNKKISLDKKNNQIGKILYNIFLYPFYLITHPAKGWSDYKYEKNYRLYATITYITLLIISLILNSTVRGFIAGGVNIKEFNLFTTILKALIPIFVGTLASWCIGSLIDGKGKMYEIFSTIAYSLYPFAVTKLIAVLLSNYLTSDEMLIYHFINGLGIALTVWMLFFGIMGIHQHSFGLTIIHLILTIIVIAVICFITLLFFSFIERIISWLSSIINELKMRYF